MYNCYIFTYLSSLNVFCFSDGFCALPARDPCKISIPPLFDWSQPLTLHEVFYSTHVTILNTFVKVNNLPFSKIRSCF